MPSYDEASTNPEATPTRTESYEAEHIRSDSGPESVATAVRKWLAEPSVTTLFIEPASPLENGYVESFNGKLSDGLLNSGIFYTLEEAQILVAGVAPALQRPAPAQLAKQPTAGTGDDRLPGLLAGRLRSAASYTGGVSGTSIGGGPTNGVRSAQEHVSRKARANRIEPQERTRRVVQPKV